MNAYCYTLSVEWQHKFGYNGWRTTKASKTEHVILMCRSKKCLNKRTLGRTDGIRLFTTFAVSVMWSSPISNYFATSSEKRFSHQSLLSTKCSQHLNLFACMLCQQFLVKMLLHYVSMKIFSSLPSSSGCCVCWTSGKSYAHIHTERSRT